MKADYVYSFNVDAVIKIKFDELKALMDGFPGSALIQRGTMLKYLIRQDAAKTQKYESQPRSNLKIFNNEKANKHNEGDSIILEFRRNSINALFYLNNTEKRDVLLLKFLSILAYLRRAYDVYINNLYEEILNIVTPYIIMQSNTAELSNSLENNYKKIIQELSASNYKLSNEIINISRYNADNAKRLKLLDDFYNQVITKFSINTFNLNNKLDALLHLGINKKLLEELSELDYNIKNKNIKSENNNKKIKEEKKE
ncbi:MAG: hypothetical protein M1538_03350 [Candidatus Marsarchaeota archaeon]|nr:hypothetical protein [Candidatus Marsarchaeota archaeon]